MYQSNDSHVAGPARTWFLGQPMPSEAAVEAAILRGRKMRSEAFWNLLTALGQKFGRAAAALRNYRRRQRAVAMLRQMDAHLLADIGLTPGDVERAILYGRERGPAKPVTALKTSTTIANDTGTTREAA